MRADPRTDKTLLSALSRVAPGTPLRAGMDDIIRAELGALLVIGDPNALSFLYSGGMRLDLPFTSQLIYELAKMDGAIILNETAQKIVYANVQLMPDPSIASEETGTRHRTAERVAKQTEALVISISQQRETVTIFVRDLRYQLGEISDVLARTNQALGTLETYRQRLDQGLTRLTALEFQSAVMLDDVLVVVQRAEMTTRMAEEIERNCVELGGEGRLIRMQLDELMEDVPRDKASIVYDYEPSGEPQKAAEVLERLAGLTHTQLLEFEELSGGARLRARDESARLRGTASGLPGALEDPEASGQRHPPPRAGLFLARCGHTGEPPGPRGGRRRRCGQGARDPRGPAAAAGAQSC